MISYEFGLEVAQCNAGQFALALQVLESLGTLGLVEALGRGFHQLVKPFQRGGQVAEPGSFVMREARVLPGRQLVEQPST